MLDWQKRQAMAEWVAKDREDDDPAYGIRTGRIIGEPEWWLLW